MNKETAQKVKRYLEAVNNRMKGLRNFNACCDSSGSMNLDMPVWWICPAQIWMFREKELTEP